MQDKTSIISAISSGNIDNLKSVVASGIIPDTRDQDIIDAFINSIKNNNDQMLSLYHACSGDMNASNYLGYTILGAAVLSRSLNLVQQAISYNANVNTPCKIRTDMLRRMNNSSSDSTFEMLSHPCLSLVNIADSNIFEFLLNAGSDPNADLIQTKGHPAAAPIMTMSLINYFAGKGNITLMQLLVLHGARINQISSDGLTPLMSAAFSGNIEIVQFLISKGADYNTKSRDGYTARDYARKRGHSQIDGYLKDLGVGRSWF